MNIVISGSLLGHLDGHPNLRVFGDLKSAIEFSRSVSEKWSGELCVIGGGEIYRQTMGMANVLFVTLISSTADGDAFYPAIDSNTFRLTQTIELCSGSAEEPKSELLIFKKIG